LSHLPPPSSSLWAALVALDRTFLVEAQRRGCLTCGGRLDRADYRRKPRGGPDQHHEVSDFDLRFALCCAVRGCRRRAPVLSARYAGRRVYVAIAVILTVALRQAAPPRQQSISVLVKAIPGCARRTIQRWIAHCKAVVPRSAWWKARAGRLEARWQGAAYRLVATFDAWLSPRSQQQMLWFAATPSP